jgi:hypothetical protein
MLAIDVCFDLQAAKHVALRRTTWSHTRRGCKQRASLHEREAIVDVLIFDEGEVMWMVVFSSGDDGRRPGMEELFVRQRCAPDVTGC